jgi:DnaJ-class molecular chaperone
MAEETIHYQVIKTTKAVRFCVRCGGSGTEGQRAYHNQVIDTKCSSCNGTGKAEWKHETRVDLVEALKELNIIKNIPNE